MTTFGKTLSLGIIVSIIIALLAFITLSPAGSVHSGPAVPTSTPAAVTSPAVSSTPYSNSELGFSLSYPNTLSLIPQNSMDTTQARTLLILANSDKTSTIRISVLMDPKTGKPLSPDSPAYENALIANTFFDGSGANPKDFSAFDMRQFGTASFAHVKTGLYEGVLGEVYYAAVPRGIIRFALTSRNVDWTNPSYDPEQDPGHLALKSLLATFNVGAYGTAVSALNYIPYQDPAGAYSVQVPAGWKANEKFAYDAIGPDKKIPGVSFSVPAAFTAGTNLGSDSYISIEKNPYAKSCVAAEFTSNGTTNPDGVTESIGSISWNIGESADAGAGNYYNERVYAAKQGSNCYGIRLFLHSGNIGNYDAGAKQQFQKTMLTAIENKVVASLQFLK